MKIRRAPVPPSSSPFALNPWTVSFYFFIFLFYDIDQNASGKMNPWRRIRSRDKKGRLHTLDLTHPSCPTGSTFHWTEEEQRERKKNARPEIAILLCRGVGKYLPVRLAVRFPLASSAL